MHELPPAIDAALVDAGFEGKPWTHNDEPSIAPDRRVECEQQLRDLKNPCRAPMVKELLAMTRRAHAKRGALPRKKDALTRDPLQDLLATCDDSLRDKLERALLLFAWSSGSQRRPEVACADVRYLRSLDDVSYSHDLPHITYPFDLGSFMTTQNIENFPRHPLNCPKSVFPRLLQKFGAFKVAVLPCFLLLSACGETPYLDLSKASMNPSPQAAASAQASPSGKNALQPK